jgi:hypothetical protein
MGRASEGYKGNKEREKMKKGQINLGDVANPEFVDKLYHELKGAIGEPDKIIIGFWGSTPEYCVLVINKKGDAYAYKGNLEEEEVSEEDLEWLGIDIGKHSELIDFRKPLLAIYYTATSDVNWEELKVSPEEVRSLEQKYSNSRTVFLL